MSSENPLDLGALIQLQENELDGHILEVEETIITEEEPQQQPEDDENTDDSETPEEAEEKTVEETPKEVIPKSNEPEEEESEESIEENEYTRYYNFLKSQNHLVVPDDFEFDGTPESLEEAHVLTENHRKQEAVAAIYGALSEDFKDAFKYALNGGSFQDFIQNIQTEEIPETLSTEEDQIKAIRAYYKETTKYSDEKINNMIDRLKQLEALEEEAEDAIDYLKDVKKEKASKLAEQQELARRQMEEAQIEARKNLESAITNSEFIPSTRKSKVKAYLNNLVTREDGQNTDFNRHIRDISTNPEHKAQLADILLSAYDPKKGFDLSRYIKQGKSRATSEFKKSLEETLDVKGRMSKGKTYTPKSEVAWSEILKQYD